MKGIEKAIQVLDTLKTKIEGKDFFTGIEITSVKKGNIYTNEVCVRVLVNSKEIDHTSIGIPQKIDGVPIEVIYRTIESQ